MKNFGFKIEKLIKKCDTLDSFITFRIEDEIEYKSLLGGLATIIFVIICIVYIIYCATSFFLRKNVELIYTNKEIEKMPLIDFRKTEFMLAFTIEYIDSALEAEIPALEYTEKYFNYTFNLRVWSGEEDIYNNYLDKKLCTKEDFFNKFNETFDLNGIGEMLCPVINKDQNFTLEGLYTDDYFKYLIIEVKLTEYAKGHMNELKKEMAGRPLQMTIFFTDRGIDYENFKEPMPSKISHAYSNIDFYFMKEITLSISTLEFTKDDNLLFDNGIK